MPPSAPSRLQPSPTPRFALRLEPPQGQLPALDGVRGLAMGMVFLYHAFLYGPWRKPFTFGWCGIELFFVLSGLLISGLVLDSKDERHALRGFYVRRALRILPLYYALLLVLYGTSAWSGGREAQRLLTEQFYFWGHLQNLFMAFNGWYQPLHFSHFWSLALEVHFYLVWPFVLRQLSARQALIACGFFAALSFTLRNTLPVAFPFSYVATFTRLEGLMIGSSMALLLREAPGWLGRVVPPLCLASGLGLVTLALQRNGLPIGDPAVIRYGYALLPLFFATVIATLFDQGRVGRTTRGFFESRTLLVIGKYSYGIFLTHWILHLKLKRPLLDALLRLTGDELGANLLSVVIQAALSLGVSMATYHLLELPCLRLKDRLAPRPRGRLAGLPVERQRGVGA